MQQLSQLIRDAVRDLDLEEEVSVRDSYSGRGMYGRSCPGLVGSRQHCMAVIAQAIKSQAEDLCGVAQCSTSDVIAAAQITFDDTVSQLLDFEQDSMGRSSIIYWPSVPAFEPEEAEADGQPDEGQEWHDFDPDC